MKTAMAKDELDKALLEAAEKGELARVKELVAQGARAMAVDGDGWQALHWAAMRGWLDMARYLVGEAGVPVDVRNKWKGQPIHAASWGGEVEIVAYLLGKGARVDAADRNGKQPLHLAAQNGCMAVAEMLLANGADPAAKHRKGKTPLDLAKKHPEVHAMLKEWLEGKNVREAANAQASQAIRARQRQLGSLRPRAPGL